jgi:uncharacterized protein YutE (UPF0331/DUF86 family)
MPSRPAVNAGASERTFRESWPPTWIKKPSWQNCTRNFALLAASGWIAAPLAETLKKIIGFRNIAVQQYQALLVPITIAVITHNLDDLLEFGSAVLRRQ